MKKVFTNSELCHVYAQQTQQEGRSHRSNLYFYGKTIYSYGSHYELGKFITKDAILINNEGYSHTTSKHIGLLIGATTQYQQFYTENTNIIKVHNKLLILTRKLAKARKPEIYIKQINDLFTYFIEYYNFCKDNKIKTFDKRTKIYREIVKMSKGCGNENYLSSIKLRLKQHKAKEKIKNEKLVKNWLSLKSPSLPYNYKGLDLLRIRSGHLETSKGLKFTISEGVNLYRALLLKKITGAKIGHYTITKVTDKALISGCHSLCLKNVHKVGKELIQLTNINK